MNNNNDLVRRADVIEAVNRVNNSHMELKGHPMLGWATLLVEVEELPSASADWIPCSERLPDERQDVYVTALWDDYGDYVTAYGMRTKFGWNLHSNAEGELIKGYTVVAWMPLPKPYEGSEGDEID